jgi:hypothetical protein
MVNTNLFFFEVDDDINWSVFIDFDETRDEFRIDDEAILRVFDPEFDTFFLLTEEDEVIRTEEDENIIWN